MRAVRIPILEAGMKAIKQFAEVYVSADGKAVVVPPDLDFGAGAYYYADIPDFEKYVSGDNNPTSIPLIVYIGLFLAWGALMYALWKWIDRH